MRSLAEHTNAKITFYILCTEVSLKNYAKEKFEELVNDIKCKLNFYVIRGNIENHVDRRNFPKVILEFLSHNNVIKTGEQSVLMLSPHIFNEDILKFIDEKNNNGIIPLFEKNYTVFDFGEEVNSSFLSNLSKTPFLDGNVIEEIIKSFNALRDEKIYAVRAAYNLMLKAKHKLFFTTKKQYNKYISENIFNEETDKIIFITEGIFNILDLISNMENLGKNTLLVLFIEEYYEISKILKTFNKVENVDYIDGRMILTLKEGGTFEGDLNLLFRDL